MTDRDGSTLIDVHRQHRLEVLQGIVRLLFERIAGDMQFWDFAARQPDALRFSINFHCAALAKAVSGVMVNTLKIPKKTGRPKPAEVIHYGRAAVIGSSNNRLIWFS
ncbi:hypothetical protein [Pseudomonas zeae]|uniref:hypothetical protein n=1 Tax=Pseudomonas zeae TaxID=2745510 RepID=UPI0039E08388